MSFSSVFKFVPATYTSWDQNPEYIEACRTEPQVGDPTAYAPAHPAGASTTDLTSFKVGLGRWNKNNLPNIFYSLWPCHAWKAFREGPKPDLKLDAQGNLVFERFPRPGCQPRPLRDFPILRGIDKISTEVPWWFVEILFRLDPRLRWEDIDMLMEHVGKRSRQPNARKFTNAFNNVCSRGRQDWFMVSWREVSKGSKANGARDRVLAALDQTQHTLNTTRGSTPGPDRFGSIVPLPTGRRNHRTRARSGKQNAATRSAQPNPISARSNKARQSARIEQLEEVDQQVEEAAEDDDDDDGSDTDFDDIPEPASRPKRKHAATVNYAVEDDSEDSAASEYEPDKDYNKKVRQHQPSREEDETFEAPCSPFHLRTTKRKQVDEAKPDVQPKKRQKVFQEENMSEASINPNLQERHSARSDYVTYGTNLKPQQRYVEEAKRHRTQRLAPHSISASLYTTPSARYGSQGIYDLEPSPIYTYQAAHPHSQVSAFGHSGYNAVNNAHAQGMHTFQANEASQDNAAIFEQGMLIQSTNGFVPSDSPCTPEVGCYAWQFPLQRDNNFLSESLYTTNGEQSSGSLKEGPAVDHERLATYGSQLSSQPSTRVTSPSSSGCDQHMSTHQTAPSVSINASSHRHTSSPLAQSPPEFCIPLSSSQAEIGISVRNASARPTQPFAHAEKCITHTTMLPDAAAQRALEADAASSAQVLLEDYSELSSWTSEWTPLFNSGTNLRGHTSYRL